MFYLFLYLIIYTSSWLRVGFPNAVSFLVLERIFKVTSIGKFLFASNSPSVELTIAGIILSLIWYVMSAQDRFLVDLYRTEVQKTGGQYALAAFGESTAKVYNYVGRTDGDYGKEYRKEREAKHRHWGKVRHWLDHVSSWRSERFSTTHLAAFIPLLATALWVLPLVIQFVP